MDDKTKTLFNLLDCLNEANKQNIECYIEVGKILDTIKEGKFYTHYASHVKDWNTFLKENNITYTDALHHINMYKFITTYQSNTESRLLTSIPLQRLKQLANSKIKPEKLQEYIDKALTLPVKDWTDEIRQLEGYKSYLECEHQDLEMFSHCKSCGRWNKL